MRFCCSRQILIALALSCAASACQTTPQPHVEATAPTSRLLVGSEPEWSKLDAALTELGTLLQKEDDFLPEELTGTTATTATTAPPPATSPGAMRAELERVLAHDHQLVQRWLDYFQSPKGRVQYERFYKRLQAFGPWLRTWLRESNMPEKLVWLAFIESGINPRAHSRAGAAGIWQFMPSTGRLSGLTYDFWLDQRRDPKRSTKAAARHLRDLYHTYQKWELVFTAYNAGPRRVYRAIQRSGHNDYWRWLDQAYVLPRETRHYVPKLIAAHRIGQNPTAYGFEFATTAPAPVSWESIPVRGGLLLSQIAGEIGLPVTDLKFYNTHIRRAVTPPERETIVRVPPEYAAPLRSALADNRLQMHDTTSTYVVRYGDTLWEIALAYGTSIRELKALNNLRGNHLRPGQRLVVPVPGQRAAPKPDYAGQTWVVRRGDTLSRIARRTGATVDDLREWNELANDTIHVGQRLRVRPLVTDESGVTYRVQRGDTLWEIARRFGVRVHALQRANDLVGHRIRPGDILEIPPPPAS